MLARFRVRWCLSIDSRLTRMGKEAVFPKEQRFKEFSTWYRKIPGKQLVAVFEGLWATEHFPPGIDRDGVRYPQGHRPGDRGGGDGDPRTQENHADAGVPVSAMRLSHVQLGREP